MDFEVYTPSGSQAYTGNARYDIEHPGGGLLTVWTHDGDKIVYGPAGWYRLEERRSTDDPEWSAGSRDVRAGVRRLDGNP